MQRSIQPRLVRNPSRSKLPRNGRQAGMVGPTRRHDSANFRRLAPPINIVGGTVVVQKYPALPWFGLDTQLRHGVDACRPCRRDGTRDTAILTHLRQCPPASHFRQGLPRRQSRIHGVPSRKRRAPPTLAQLRVIVIEIHHVVVRRQRRPLRHQLPVHRQRIGRNPRLQPLGGARF